MTCPGLYPTTAVTGHAAVPRPFSRLFRFEVHFQREVVMFAYNPETWVNPGGR
jgi:hypothetical protein